MSAILTVFKLEERAYEGVFAPLLLFVNLERKMKIFFGKKASKRRSQQHFIPLVPNGVSYCSSLTWSLIMTDVHSAEFTYIIVSNRTGKRIFITGGGGTET